VVRNREWCEHVAATVLGTLSTQEICRSWTEVTEDIVKTAWTHQGLQEEHLVLIAMGKLASYELNLSSDIDLVVVGRNLASRDIERRLKGFTQSLQNFSDFGFCYRVDWDLRPGGRVGVLAPHIERVEDHFWSDGETWERIAWARSRILCGPKDLVDDVSTVRNQFVYRRFVDFRLYEDLAELRTKIFSHDSESRSESLFNLKLGSGGIRDIELFLWSLKVIHGGRNRDLSDNTVNDLLQYAVKVGAVSDTECNFLLDQYWKLRHEENCLQAYEDQQTQTVPTEQILPRWPSFLVDRARTTQIVDRILGVSQTSAETNVPTAPFSTEAENALWQDILSTKAKSSRGVKDEAHRRHALVGFIEPLRQGRSTELGLKYLLDFFRGARTRASLFALLARSPEVARNLGSLFANAPNFAQILTDRPDILDSFLLGHRLSDEDVLALDWDEFLENLVELKLLTQISQTVKIHQDSDDHSWGPALSEAADRITRLIIEKLRRERGPTALEYLRLGKWAGSEMGLQSDLDFFFVSPNHVTESDIAIARRCVNRLTEPHRGGSLYNLDFRLRPTGKAGPLAIHSEQLFEYTTRQAPSWERQSYYRARTDSGIGTTLQKIVVDRGFSDSDREELLSIRTALMEKKSGPADVKLHPGGLLHIEFVTQISAIDRKIVGRASTLDLITSLAAVEPQWALAQSSLSRCYQNLRWKEQLSLATGNAAQDTEATLRLSQEILKTLDPITTPK
jgi:[glutamine synthetase] adenylyltransferase / [glutamine synthetase]-adenylyl-L-tyrosine phosphorylase